jgi:hypothetical protein
VDPNVFDEHTSKIANAIGRAGEELATTASHWLREIAGTLDKINTNLERIDTDLERIGDKID